MVAIAHPTLPTLPIRRPVTAAAVYRRRRLGALGLLLLLAALVLPLLDLVRGGPAGDLDSRPVARVSVTVQPGDTVWSIASGLDPAADPRPIVDAIVDANGGAGLVAGQRLEITLP